MTVLLASVCVTTALLLRSMGWYLAVVFCHDGWRRWQYCRATRTLPREYGDRPDPSRIALRQGTRTQMTALGESFSEWLLPSHKRRTTGGIPSVTNPYVNAIALICVILGVILSLFLAIAASRALLESDYRFVALEAGVAIAAVLGGLLTARALSLMLGERKEYTFGVLTILLAGLLGALGAGHAMRSFLCTPQLSPPLGAGMNHRVK